MVRPAYQRKPKSAAIIELRNKAKRQGWAKHIRQGEGEQADEKAMLNGCVFDTRRAEHVCEFFERYGYLTEGAFKSKQIVLQPWQRLWLHTGFGWIRFNEEWGEWVRRFKYFYLEVPKKNGKTPFIATLGNYLLFADALERQVNTFLAATTKQQAEKCIIHAARAVKYWDDWQAFAEVKKLEGFTSIHYGSNTWSVIPADETSTDGVNGHVLADELHLWKGREFYDSLRWALASQPEGVFAAITTAGHDPESVCRICHEKTLRVNRGHETSQDWFGTIYAAEKDDDPHDEETWFKANPSLGTKRSNPLKLSDFRADYETAKLDPPQWNKWKQKRLNIWRTSTETWIEIEKWDVGKIGRLTADGKPRKRRIDCYEKFDEETYDWQALESVMAFDGATVRDTTSAVFTFEHPTDEGVLLFHPYFWMPESRAIELQNKVPFRTWSENGHIVLTDGDAVDFDFIFRDLVALIEFYGIEEYYFDPMFQAEWLTQRLSSETGAERKEFPQTILQFSPCMKTAERMILDKRIRHNGHPVFNWQFGNVRAKSNANDDVRPEKQKHGDYRTIDGPVALLMTIRKWLTESEDGDFYDDNDLEVF